MKISLRKNKSGTWSPAFPQDEETGKKFKHNEIRVFSIASRRSIPEHGMFFAYLNDVFDNQEEYDDKEALRQDFFFKIGYGTFRYIDVQGTQAKIFIPGSIAFEKCSQETFHNRVFVPFTKAIEEHFGISFDEWKNDVWNWEGKCDNQFCQHRATQEHHIFMGANRTLADKHGYTVRVCNECHDYSHGKEGAESDTLPEGAVAIRKFWCRMKKIDYNEAMVKMGVKREGTN